MNSQQKAAVAGIFLFFWAALPSLFRGQAAAQSTTPPLPSPPPTGTVVFTEDFSQGFKNWAAIRNSASYWSIVNGAAEAFVPTLGTLAEMIPLDTVWSSSWKDIEYELDFTPLQGVDRNISFGFENLLNWYEIHFVDMYFNLVRVFDGKAPFSIDQPYTLANGRTYRIKIRFFQGRIEIFIDGEKIADKFDFTFNNNYGKIGIKAGTGAVAPTRVRFDNIVVRTLSSIPGLDVPLFKQIDPLWQNQEYDNATAWSNKPTIGRWGCAMTSMVMVMRYHGITKFPDGNEITPASLNAWLKNQADGYIGEGALNWLAVTRLTKQINNAFGTPKLEYNRVNSTTLDTAKSEITAGKPVILQILGHFLVGSGVTSNGQDLIIKDPAYTYTNFSQHNHALISTRTFQPSQTDLSYLLIVSNKPVQLNIKNASGATLPMEENHDEVRDPVENSGEKTPAVFQYTLPKPETGIYNLELSSPTISSIKAQVFAYDEHGEVKMHTIESWISPTPLSVKINFSKTGQTTFSSPYSFGQLRQELKQLLQQKQFTSTLWQLKLDRTAQLGQSSQRKSDQQRYADLLTTQLRQSAPWLTPTGKQFLESRIKLLKSQLK